MRTSNDPMFVLIWCAQDPGLPHDQGFCEWANGGLQRRPLRAAPQRLGHLPHP